MMTSTQVPRTSVLNATRLNLVFKGMASSLRGSIVNLVGRSGVKPAERRTGQVVSGDIISLPDGALF